MESVDASSKPYKCGLCGLDFALTTSLSAHKTIEHHEDPPHRCSLCCTAFFNPDSYGTHIFKHSLERRNQEYFQCCECLLEYPSEHGLRVHISKHTGVTLQSRGKMANKRKQFLVCDYCPAIIKGAERFREHLKIHNEVKPYECEQCHVTFRIKYQLDLHKRRHRELKDLPQEVVDRYFSQVPFGCAKMTKKEKV